MTSSVSVQSRPYLTAPIMVSTYTIVPTLKMLELCVFVSVKFPPIVCVLICDFLLVCVQGDIRLVGGATEFEGRVEVCVDNAWGTVCDDSWGVADGNIVCRQLSYGIGKHIKLSSVYL